MRGAAQAVALLLVCALAAAEESDGTVAVCGTGPLLPAFFALLALLCFCRSRPLRPLCLAPDAETPGLQASVLIAGFPTSHDVMEHAKIDRDVVSIECQVAKHTPAGYAAANKIYEEGGADACSDSVPSQPGSKLGSGGMRTLASFYPGAHENTAGLAHTVATEPFNKMFDEYEALNNMPGRDKGYNPHSEVVFALKGEQEYATGDDAQITSSAEFRDQVIKKGIKYQVMMIYALHELEIAVAAYKELGAGSDKPKLYTDVWWAFYAGSRETGSATGGGFSPYKLAEKRAKFFGTDTASINNGGKSKVNDILIKATYEIKRLFSLAEDSTAENDNVMKCVRAQLKVPLIQGCIQYGKLSKLVHLASAFTNYDGHNSRWKTWAGYKTDTSTNFDDGSATDGYHSEKARKGEIWSFCAGALPFLHEADAPSAVTLFEQVKVDGLSARMPAWTTVKSVFTAANLNKMGVKCADVGGFVDKSADKTSATTLGSDFLQCTDGTLSSAHADSGQCAGDWMSRVVVPDTYDGVAADAAASDAGGSGSGTSDATKAYATFLPTMLAAAMSAALLKH